ncbi:DUF4351 domain-containing protein [Rubidibacter lacunae]|uniref:DUF4351 domain-containing protein n=1 Tax=Rubidibacter lacunae TaxID=582514 RepID=UPI0022B3F2E6|nr:DUF4351 domain-containing protein [Rubidibacter lacunae]
MLELAPLEQTKPYQEGRQDMIFRMVIHKFGEVTPELREQVSNMKSEELGDLAEAILDFTRVDDLQSWFQDRQSC